MRTIEAIVIAGGCFWGAEHFMKQIPGVVGTEAGYVNSTVANPTYREVCSGETGAAEGVRVSYDPEIVDMSFLLELYFMTIDPVSMNRQGGDVGSQYRTGIYYSNPLQHKIAVGEIEKLQSLYDKPLAVEIKPLLSFYPAEDYHQDYLKKNPRGYCHVSPELFEIARRARRYKRPSDEELHDSLTPIQWDVTQNAATEPPFTGEYNNEYRKGIYVDAITGEPLFVSNDKFDSGCGWPAFSQPIFPESVIMRQDNSHGMNRVEVLSRQGRSHLGHVFNDGPRERGGLRYCINSASLRFIPVDEMKAAGYGQYMGQVK